MGNWHGHKAKYLTAAFQKLRHCHLLRKGKKEIVITLTNSVEPKYNSVMGFVVEFVKFGIHSILQFV
jgi:hypothetical protein